MNAIIAALVVWIAAETGLPISEPPTVRLVPTSMLQVGVPPGRVGHGGYLCAQRLVLLPESWRPDAWGRAVLAHELTHHLQCVAGVDAGSEDSERQARAIGAHVLTAGRRTTVIVSAAHQGRRK